jgi:hypothetical protein
MAKRVAKDGYSTEFQYNDLTVVVSRSVLQAWEAQRDLRQLRMLPKSRLWRCLIPRSCGI